MAQPSRTQTARAKKPAPAVRQKAAAPVTALHFNPDEDRFAVPDAVRRKGYRLEWKRYLVLGKPDLRNISQLQREKWQIVPAERWPDRYTGAMGSLLPKQDYIELEGMILMERLESICQAVEAFNHDKTAQMTAAKEAEMGETPAAQAKTFPRHARVETTIETPEERAQAAEARGARGGADDGEDYT